MAGPIEWPWPQHLLSCMPPALCTGRGQPYESLVAEVSRCAVGMKVLGECELGSYPRWGRCIWEASPIAGYAQLRVGGSDRVKFSIVQ